MANSATVRTVYQTVVDDVINGVREAFLDEGMDESILLELKQLWENKLHQSKAVDSSHPVVAAHGVAQGHEPQGMQSYPSHPAAARLTTQQKQQSGTVLNVVPPVAHQGSASLQPPFSFQLTQGTHPMQYTNLGATQMSSAASTGLLALPASYQQLAAQGRITLQNGQFMQLIQGQQIIGSLPVTQSNAGAESKPINISLSGQLDGVGDSSSDEEEDDDEDNDDDDEVNDENEDAAGEEEEPLNSGDDVSDADPTEVFDAENVVVCQFDKINRSKNKWKFHLKDGIMNLNGKDYVFQKASGEAEW